MLYNKQYKEMLDINENGRIHGEEIHSKVGSKRKNYRDWINDKIEYADLIEDQDFLGVFRKSTGGRPKKQFEFTVSAAKEICLLERSDTGKKIRRWLIGLSEQKEDLDLLTHEQVIFLSKLKAVFSYISECKNATKLNASTHVSNNPSKYAFAEFHKMRNEILKLDPKVINERLKNYCIENNRPLPKGKAKIEKLIVIDRYEVLRNGVWDFLTANGEEQSLKLANLVKRMAEAENLAIKRVNEEDLMNKIKDLPKLNK